MNLHAPNFDTQNPRPKRPKRPTPFPYGLRYIASFLPQGMESMMHLARLSEVLKARKVAWAWDGLSKPERDSVLPESLCDQVGITSADFLAAVMSTGFELSVDVGALFGAIVKMPDALSAALRQASSTGINLDEAYAILRQIGREVRRR